MPVPRSRFRAFARLLAIVAFAGMHPPALAAEAESPRASDAKGPSASELVRKYVEANGGVSNVRDLESIAASGTSFGRDGEATPIRVIRKRPDKLKMIFDLGDRRRAVVYNSGEAWEELQFRGRVKVEPINGERRASLARSSSFELTLREHWRDRETELEALGKETVDGRETYRLVARLPGGEEAHYWLDANHYQEVRIRRENGGAVTVDYSDYVRIGGVYVAKRSVRRIDGEVVSRLEFDSVRGDVGVFDSFFKRPEE